MESINNKNCEHCSDCKNGTCCVACSVGENAGVKKCWCGKSNCGCKSRLMIIAALLVGIAIGFALNAGHGMKRQGMRCESGEMCDHQMMGHDMHMEGMMASMVGNMDGLSGDELDRQFLEDMIVHHQGAVLMATKLLEGTDRPELKKMGADIIRVQNAEIEQMQSWLDTWFSAE